MYPDRKTTLNEVVHFFKLANVVFMITIFNQHQRLAQLNEPGNFKISPRFLHVTKFKIRVTNWTISVIFRFPH